MGRKIEFTFFSKYTIKTDKAYFVASERVFDTCSETTKYALSVFIVYLFIFQLHKFNIDMYIQV